jgi:catechol 2,3-dioxygenase-like lactoylglutathione lyase family enzyme
MTGFNLDHVGIAVADLDAAAAQYRRLGFQLTARGYHTLPAPTPGAPRPRLGTGNNCAMLKRGYLELIGIVEPDYQGRLRADIAHYQGVHIIAFGTADAAASADALRRAGIAVTGPRIVERPIEEGTRTDLARFDIVDFPDALFPEGHFFAIGHATPELLWKPPLLAHPNGVVGLDTLTIAVGDPADFAARLGRTLSVSPVRGEGLVVKLAEGEVRVVDAAWLAAHVEGTMPTLPYVAGLGLAVETIAKTENCLGANGVTFRRAGPALMVDPARSCGAFLEFREKS